jgi:hypothetical protein
MVFVLMGLLKLGLVSGGWKVIDLTCYRFSCFDSKRRDLK